MASMSGLRSIMEDIATSTAGSDAGEWLNLSIGNPASIPEVMQAWQELTEEALAKNFGEASCNYGPSRGAASLVLAITGGAFGPKTSSWARGASCSALSQRPCTPGRGKQDGLAPCCP